MLLAVPSLVVDGEQVNSVVALCIQARQIGEEVEVDRGGRGEVGGGMEGCCRFPSGEVVLDGGDAGGRIELGLFLNERLRLGETPVVELVLDTDVEYVEAFIGVA